MNILVTGNLGYIGSILVPELQSLGHSVTGLDSGFYEPCTLSPSVPPCRQLYRDIRDVQLSDLNEIDVLIHLAGLSNDPLGELSPGLTEVINYEATVRLANLSRIAGIQRFIYASSQSMYGVSDTTVAIDEDNSPKNPVTSYAKTKWDAEVALFKLCTPNFIATAFRPSTVFGASPRLRCDIVFNNLVACAFTSGRIEIKSDGTPWRPVVHIKDVCKAFIAGIDAPSDLVQGQAFNVGILHGNYTVRELAEAAQRSVPGSTLEFTGEHGSDSRTYRVSFDKIHKRLGDYYKPSWNLDSGGSELVSFFTDVNLTEQMFRGPLTNRINQINQLLAHNLVDSNLFFINK